MISIYAWLSKALAEEYQELRLIKEGPRGSVRRIRHRTSGKEFILRRFTGNPEVYQKLLDYTCPHLPTIYEVASRGQDNLVVEEFVRGDTLGSLLQGSLFTVEETKRIVRQVCRALWVLHSIGAVHRDVKPENIILRDRQAVLIDFDAARFHKPENQNDTQILGTVGFAAPEQYGLSQSDIRTDIYALGVLINVMLTGEHPSRELTRGRLGRVVDRCTHVNPQRRYKNVLRLMEALS
ncbi:serine/threonine-protein kinase [Pseudoflavonifractor phocaeensis]|uniref:serine/threonine-protein kinase n=1 Tax=Pseudoflavonifractor phocaeensis TaxID=1870988 RepID=UPI00195AE4E2|nr:serine/threonine-protein kinase [Pseudoflavonifractor phocaeensis]MBM6927132.1 serine/threonine protein kinase [Pseudoflavonifractor phocaeensis]